MHAPTDERNESMELTIMEVRELKDCLRRYADPTQLYPVASPMSLTIVGNATATIVWSNAARNTVK